MGMTSTFWDIPGIRSQQSLDFLLQLLGSICVYNESGQVVYASTRFLELLCIRADAVKVFGDCFVEPDHQTALSAYWNDALQGQVIQFFSEVKHTGETVECSLQFNADARLMFLVAQKPTQTAMLCRLAEEYGRLILTLFNHPNLATAIISPDGHVVKCNQKLYELFGIDECSPFGLEDFVCSEDKQLDADLRQKLLSGEIESYTIEKRYVTTSQELLWVNMSVSLLDVPFFMHGHRRYFAVLLEDITENRKIYSALVRTEGKWKAFVLNSLNLFIQVGNTGQIVYVSPAVEQVLGFSSEELLDLSVSQLIHPDDRNEFELALHLWASEVPSNKPGVECRWKTRSGEWAHLYMQGQQFPLALEIDGIALSGYDITDRKQLETKLKGSEAKFRSLVLNIPGAVFRCDSTYTMEFISDGIQAISGYSADEFINNQARSYISLIHPDDIQLIQRSMIQAILNRHPYSVEYRILHASGQIRWISERRQGVFDRDGRLLWFDGVLFDISNHKQTEENLRRSEAINRAMVQVLPNLMLPIHHAQKFPGLVSTNQGHILPWD